MFLNLLQFLMNKYQISLQSNFDCSSLGFKLLFYFYLVCKVRGNSAYDRRGV